MPPASHATADRRSTLLWLTLLAATALTWAIGEGHASGPAIAALLLAVAMAKGTVVIFDFMALARAPLLWRIVLLGWLALVCALIGLAYWKGMP